MADDLRTVLWPMPTDNDPASWALRAEAWQHEDVLLGGSDSQARIWTGCAGRRTPPASWATVCAGGS